jgi:hypothetical protein
MRHYNSNTERLKKKHITFLLLIFVILLYVLLFSTYNKTGIARAQHDQITYDYEYVPIDSVAIVIEDDALTVMPGDSLSLGVSFTPEYASMTVKSIKFLIVSGLDFARVTNNGFLTILESAPIDAEIKVVVTADNVISDEYILTIIKIPVTGIEISAICETVDEGSCINIISEVLPLNATNKIISYEILTGNEYASIDENGLVRVSSNIENANATFSVQVFGEDDIRSNVLHFNIYTPTKSLLLASDDLSPTSNLEYGSSINLYTYVSEFASRNEPTFIINYGDEYIDSITDNVLTIKSNIQTHNAQISICTMQDGIYSNDIILSVYIPATSIVITTSDDTINAGGSLNINNAIFPAYASTNELVYTMTSGHEYASIDSNTGLIKVRNDIPISNATISVKVSRDNIDSNILTFKIYIPANNISLYATKTTLISSLTEGDTAQISAEVDENATSLPIFTIIAGLEYVESYIEGALVIKPGIMVDGAYIDIKATCDDASANIRINISRVKVSNIILNAPASLDENSTYQISAPYILPTNAVLQTYKFSISHGGVYASITDSGYITIKPNISIPNAVIKIKATSDGIESEEKEIKLIVPVKSLSILTNKTSLASTSSSGDSAILTPVFNVGCKSLPTNTDIIYYVESTTYIDSSVISTGTELVGNIVKIKKDIPSGMLIKVYGISGGVISSYISINIIVPVEKLSLLPSATTINSYSKSANCEKVAFTPVFNTNLNPPTDTSITYYVDSTIYVDNVSIYSGTVLKENSIKVKANIKNGVLIKVYAISGGIKSDTVVITVTVPVETLTLSANSNVIKSYSKSENCETVVLTSSFNKGLQIPTNETITYYTDSSSYIDSSSILAGTTLKGNSIKVKAGVVSGAIIKVYAISGGVQSSNVLIIVEVPVQTLIFSQTELDRGLVTTLTPIYNSDTASPTYAAWECTSISPSTININSNTNKITLPKTITYGATITLKYRAKNTTGNFYGSEFTKVFNIKKLTSSKFKLEYSTDSQGYTIDTLNPQLETGQYTDITAKYDDTILSGYGLSANISSATNATISGMRLTANKVDGNKVIKFAVKVVDGDTSYLIEKSFLVFHRATGQPTSTTSVIYNKETTLSKYVGTLTSPVIPTGYTQPSCMSFVEIDGSYYSLTTNGLLTIKSKLISPTINVQMTFDQGYYNGNKVTYISSPIQIKIKTVTFNKQSGSGGTDSIIAVNNITGNISVPTRFGYDFKGYYSSTNGYGTQYFNSTGARTTNLFTTSYSTLYAHWVAWSYTFIERQKIDDTIKNVKTYNYTYDQTVVWTKADNELTFKGWYLNDNNGERLVSTEASYTLSKPNINKGGTVTLTSVWTKDSCVATGTLITLSDGTMRAVEDLTGEELILVWNLWTGAFDFAPLIFIDREPTATNKIINLHFSDGTNVKVITEHGFWDYDLNKYVFLDENATHYIGHYFAKETLLNGELILQRVQLIEVVITEEFTGAWSPVTAEHLCYFVNGMLSMPASTDSFINIFNVDPSKMRYDEVQLKLDILMYGLFSYDDFSTLIPYEMYIAFGGAYLKIAIGKGITTMEEIQSLIEHYSRFLLT